MTLTWKNLSEEELEMGSLLPEEEYNFIVIDASYSVARKTNNPMIRLKLKIFDNQGGYRLIYDCLMATPGMLLRLKHFLECVGMPDKYDEMKLTPEDCIGKTGRAYIVREPKKRIENSDEFYAAKNAVKDYLLLNNLISNDNSTLISTSIEENFDDAIPF